MKRKVITDLRYSWLEAIIGSEDNNNITIIQGDGRHKKVIILTEREFEDIKAFVKENKKNNG